MMSEQEFLDQTGCPPEELQNWLEIAWIHRFIKAVLAGTEKVGLQPCLLVRYEDNCMALRLFCPTEKLLVSNPPGRGPNPAAARHRL